MHDFKILRALFSDLTQVVTTRAAVARINATLAKTSNAMLPTARLLLLYGYARRSRIYSRQARVAAAGLIELPTGCEHSS